MPQRDRSPLYVNNLHLLEKPDHNCEKCRFSLPCLFGHDSVRIRRTPMERWEPTTAPIDKPTIDFCTAVTYGEIMMVQASVVPSGETQIEADRGEYRWTTVPYHCPRFNPRAKVWHDKW